MDICPFLVSASVLLAVILVDAFMWERTVKQTVESRDDTEGQRGSLSLSTSLPI